MSCGLGATLLSDDYGSYATNQAYDCEPRRQDSKGVRGHHETADGGSRGISEAANNEVTFHEMDDDPARYVCESAVWGKTDGPFAVDFRENPPGRDHLCDGIVTCGSRINRVSATANEVEPRGELTAGNSAGDLTGKNEPELCCGVAVGCYLLDRDS